MRLAILGGTFNPIHYGHLFIAEVARTTCGFGRIIFVPTNIPAHKAVVDEVGPRERLRMVQLALRGMPEFVCDPCEIERGGVSYMIDTVREIERRYRPEGRVGLIIGDDLAAGFGAWRAVDELVEKVELLVCRRSADAGVRLPYAHRELPNAVLPISSTQIRERIAQGRTVRFLLPERVLRYIERRGFYRA